MPATNAELIGPQSSRTEDSEPPSSQIINAPKVRWMSRILIRVICSSIEASLGGYCKDLGWIPFPVTLSRMALSPKLVIVLLFVITPPKYVTTDVFSI